MDASEPKWVNPVLNIIAVNSLRLGGLQLYNPGNLLALITQTPSSIKLSHFAINLNGCVYYYWFNLAINICLKRFCSNEFKSYDNEYVWIYFLFILFVYLN